MTEPYVIQRVECAFEKAVRPQHFTKHTHCDKCLKIDLALSARDRATWTAKDWLDVGELPLLTAEAFRYCFPSLVRCALADDAVLGLIMNILQIPIAKGTHVLSIPHVRHFSAEEVKATADFIRHVSDTRPHLFEQPARRLAMKRTLRNWQADVY